jgi:hypothetical protein
MKTMAQLTALLNWAEKFFFFTFLSLTPVFVSLRLKLNLYRISDNVVESVT